MAASKKKPGEKRSGPLNLIQVKLDNDTVTKLDQVTGMLNSAGTYPGTLFRADTIRIAIALLFKRLKKVRTTLKQTVERIEEAEGAEQESAAATGQASTKGAASAEGVFDRDIIDNAMKEAEEEQRRERRR